METSLSGTTTSLPGSEPMVKAELDPLRGYSFKTSALRFRMSLGINKILPSVGRLLPDCPLGLLTKNELTISGQ
jgi:hypothetical protein